MKILPFMKYIKFRDITSLTFRNNLRIISDFLVESKLHALIPSLESLRRG